MKEIKTTQLLIDHTPKKLLIYLHGEGPAYWPQLTNWL